MSQALVLSGLPTTLGLGQGRSRAGGLLWDSGGVVVSGTGGGGGQGGLCGGEQAG